jgi:hypothetical protein
MLGGTWEIDEVVVVDTACSSAGGTSNSASAPG